MRPTRVVILTGSELRHRFVRKALALSPGLDVALSVCEPVGRLFTAAADGSAGDIIARHIGARARSEQDFFGAFDAHAPDRSNQRCVERGAVNDDDIIGSIRDAKPDAILAYGCSIVRGLLQLFPRRIVNIHLGLSPWYRGSGTNFWPLVEGKPEFVGVTFMHMDAGVDTGEIIHQVRADIALGDGPHDIGNRIIADMIAPAASILRSLPQLRPAPQPNENGREYKRRELTDAAVESLYRNFNNGMIENYLDNQQSRNDAAPIVINPEVAA